jgi:hypothetical protein
MLSNRETLVLISSELKNRNRFPKNLDFTKVGDFHWVNSYDGLNANIIHESVTTGFDRNQDLAAVKSLVEYCERRAFDDSYGKGENIAGIERSDGMAAFPIISSLGVAREKARSHALGEALERFAWATWWDDKDIAFQITAIDVAKIDSLIGPVKDSIQELFLVTPKMEYGDFEVLILILFLKNGGVASGGACGKKVQRPETLDRAGAELLRHALAVSRMKESNLPLQSFYENRLQYFTTTEGEAMVRERLAEKGAKAVVIPPLIMDEEINYSLSDLVYVHRCLFQNQPLFIGGKLERFCI